MPPGPFVCLVGRELGCRLTELRAGRYGKRGRRGTSSVGRASASQAEGRGFETRVPLQDLPRNQAPRAFVSTMAPKMVASPALLSRRRIALSRAAGDRCMYRIVVFRSS